MLLSCGSTMGNIFDFADSKAATFKIDTEFIISALLLDREEKIVDTADSKCPADKAMPFQSLYNREL